MLKLVLGTDWRRNSEYIYRLISKDVAKELGGRILIVPETISHNSERDLCKYAGDTASRFAEVLSFSRLPDRLRDCVGCGESACMDNGGRVIAMAAGALQLHSKLKAYASVETRPEFLINLVDAVDEFKSCCIDAKDLKRASELSQGSLAQKLEELSLLLESYDALCAQGKRDPRDRLTWLLEVLEDSDFAADRVFYLNGFTDFTGQQSAVLRHFIEMSEKVVVSLTCDEPGSKDPAFEKAGETAAQLLRFAKELGVESEIEIIPALDDEFSYVCRHLFRGAITVKPELNDHLSLYQTGSLTDECEAAARKVINCVRSGSRYRDIRIVCTDISAYSNPLKMCFARYGIPVYISGTEDILDMPVINTVLTALEAATCGYEQKDVMRYLRSLLSPLDMDTCDSIDNYAFMWNIHGDRWKREWTYHPEGIGREMDVASEECLSKLNEARNKALNPLIRLEEGFKEANTLKDQVLCLYRFLENIELADRLEQMAERACVDGENAMIQVFNQLWEILLNALEQLYDVLGFSTWDTENFVKLLKLLLSQYDVGTIPPVLDAVTIGSVSSMRFMQETDLIILGASDGNFPNYTKKAGVLSDQERSQLRSLGVPLAGGTLEGLQSQFADIYNIICGASDSITVSCPAGQPSYIYKRLLSMVSKESPVSNTVGATDCNTMDAAAYLVRYATREDAEHLDLTDAFAFMKDAVNYDLGAVSTEGVQQLYGDNLNLSASKIDTVADCRLSYFLKYGIRAKERREATIDPMEFGTYVHDVLENTAREIKAKGGFHNVSLTEAIEIANHFAKVYAQVHFSQIDSERMSYLFSRNTQELEFIVTELWEELQHSEFEPWDFELGFGNGGKMDYIHFGGKVMQAKLEGKVDRVDVWNNGHQNYFRVVDYKTGSKDFDYCDIFNGIGLQMFLYLFALEENGEDLLGKYAVPAGVQYFPARVPIIPVDGLCDDEEIKNKRIAETKRKGLILQDDAVLHAMEDYEKPLRMNYSRRKDGTTVGSLADREQMKMLKTYIFRLLSNFVDDISSGCVAPNPYTRGTKHNPCWYCPYSAVCHPSYVEGRREYKEMSAQWFWDAVREENDKNG